VWNFYVRAEFHSNLLSAEFAPEVVVKRCVCSGHGPVLEEGVVATPRLPGEWLLGNRRRLRTSMTG